MATGRKTVVVGQVIAPTAWGNPLWDQSVQTFTGAADRTAQFPAPKQGAVTWLEDVKRLEVFTGTAWIPVVPDKWGKFAGALSATGTAQIAHGLGAVPGYVGVTDCSSNAIVRSFVKWSCTLQTSALIEVTGYNSTTGGALAGNPAEFFWEVKP
jgi:hypothetical protein